MTMEEKSKKEMIVSIGKLGNVVKLMFNFSSVSKSRVSALSLSFSCSIFQHSASANMVPWTDVPSSSFFGIKFRAIVFTK